MRPGGDVMKPTRITRRHTLAMSLAILGMGASVNGIVDSPRLAAQTPEITTIQKGIFRLPPVDSDVKEVVVTAMAMDPRGELLAVAGDDHVIRILNSKTMQIMHVLGNPADIKDGKPGHFDWIRTLDFDDNGSTLSSAGNDGQLILWDRRSDFEVLQEIKSAPALACVCFSPTGKQMAAVGFDSRVFLIGATSHNQPSLKCDCIDLRCCVYRSDSKTLAVAGRNGQLHLFDPVSGDLQHEERLHKARVRDMKFLPNSNVLVSVSEDGEVVQYDTVGHTILSRRKITSGRLFTVAVIDANTIAAAGSDDGIHIVRFSNKNGDLQITRTLVGHVGSISTLIKSNGALISGGYDATIRRWDLPSLQVQQDKVALKDDSVSVPAGDSSAATSR